MINKKMEPLSYKLPESQSCNYFDLDLSFDVKKPAKEFIRKQEPDLPQLSELQVMRHYTKLSNLNYGVDTGFYPLGSCTMKYNPKINEDLAKLEGFTALHPYQDESEAQGSLSLMYELGELLKKISGMDGVTLLPAAGAHGESTGLKIIDAYHVKNGGFRKKIIIPDTAHGTNPASSSTAGHVIVPVKSQNGILKKQDIAALVDGDTAALMLTNPNTLGIFEAELADIARLLHDKGAFLYCDGANTNAWMGQCKLGDMGVDVIQYNLHKTFSTPHGGGGPGSGPVVVSSKLKPFLPIPQLVKNNNGTISIKTDNPDSIGRIKMFYGQFLVFIKAYAYLLMLGGTGIKKVSEIAVLNANYIKAKLKDYYHLAIDADSMHEVVFSDKKQNEHGVKTLDIAKRLLDYGYHPPTIYFPLVVHGAIMIEPTETETKDELDKFCDAMIQIAKEAESNPELLTQAPHTTPVARCNEVVAAKNPILQYTN